MFGITDPLTFLLGTVFIILLPGPNSLFILTTATRRGVRAGWQAAGGVVVGDFILIFLAAIGAASVLYANPALFLTLKYVGAAYLTYIGLGLLRQAWRGWRQAPSAQNSVNGSITSSGGGQSAFRRALAISLVNPKSILFFVSFFVQFVDPLYPNPALTFALLGLIVQACSVLYMAGLILGGAQLAARLGRHPRVNAVTAAGVGLIFIAFGVKLADATLR